MNENRCPNCELLNLPDANICLQCKTQLSGARQTNADVATSPTSGYQNRKTENSHVDFHAPPTPFGPRGALGQTVQSENKVGRRTHFWYRIFCSLIVISGVVIAIFGFLAILGSATMEGEEGAEAFAGGLFFLFVGLPPVILYFLGVVLPSKPYHWFYGVFLLGLSIVSCFLAPFAIPLLIFWMRSETQAFFERGKIITEK